MVTKLVIKPRGCQIEAVGVWKQSPVAFKLAINIFVSCNLSSGQARDRAHRECCRENASTSGSGQCRFATQAGDRSCSQTSKSTYDRGLIVADKLSSIWTENGGICQQRQCILRI